MGDAVAYEAKLASTQRYALERLLFFNGCWDWWGYEDSRYALREGPQMLAVRAMIADLRGETPR